MSVFRLWATTAKEDDGRVKFEISLEEGGALACAAAAIIDETLEREQQVRVVFLVLETMVREMETKFHQPRPSRLLEEAKETGRALDAFLASSPPDLVQQVGEVLLRNWSAEYEAAQKEKNGDENV